MSGKIKQANRTKNNVRPSSSGRSAEQISSMVNPALVVVGPGNLLPAVFPSLAGHCLDQPISNEFLLCFKKFHKKDPITKIKALNELKDLVGKSEQDVVVNALGSWAHYYPSLTVDIDRKVREATQACHGVIVRKCGRQVALHIKRLLPAWLLAQHDEHAPVQRVAQHYLNTTFPNDEKLTEAIKFCKVEICNLYLDNLKGNAEYMLSGKKLDDEEEREAQIARVISCTLRAMELLVRKLPASQEQWLWNTLLPLLCANSYWKMAAHSSSSVRSSWYVVTGAVVIRFHSEMAAELARRCARTLLAHPETVPSVCVERWRAFLALVYCVPDFVNLLDKKDLLIKRLWEALENAAWGEASRLSEVLKTLLNLVPSNMHTEEFYNNFFKALFTGLSQKTLLKDEIEREKWNGIIAECTRHLSVVHDRDEYIIRLISWAHRSWLETVLSLPEFPGKKSLIASTASHMVQVLNFWIKLAKFGGEPIYEHLTCNFWQNISSTILAEVEKLVTDTNVVNVTEAHMLFIIELKQNIYQSQNKESSETIKERCGPDLENTTENLVGSILNFAHKHKLVRKILPMVMAVLQEFHGPSMLRSLAQKFGVDSIFQLYDGVLKGWLLEDKQKCFDVVKLVFLLIPCLEDQEQNAVFDSFGKLSSDVVQWCFSLALVPPHRGSAAVARWVRTEPVHAALTALVRRYREPEARHLLLAALSRHNSDDVMITEKTISGIVCACDDLLSVLVEDESGRGGAERRDREDVVRFAAQIARALPAEHAACALPLLFTLFQLTLRIPRDSPLLEAEAWSDALRAWRAAAAHLPHVTRAAFVSDALHHIHRQLYHALDKLDILHIDHVVSLCPHLVLETTAPALVAHSQLVLDLQDNNKMTLHVPLEVFALQLDVIWGDLSCPFEKDNSWIAAVVGEEVVLSKETLMVHVQWILFRALYIKKIISRPVHDTELVDQGWCEVFKEKYFRDQFCNILHDYAVLNVLYDHYAFWMHYNIICEVKDHMERVVLDIASQFPMDLQGTLSTTLEKRADTHGYYWVRAKQHYKHSISNVLELNKKLEEISIEKNTDGACKISPIDSNVDVSDRDYTSETDVADGTNVTDADSERTDSQQSHSMSSFEIVNAVDNIGTDVTMSNASNADTDTKDTDSLCNCHQLHYSTEEVFSSMLLDKLQDEGIGQKKRSYLSNAVRPEAKLASTCEKAALFVDQFGQMVLKNGYFHDIQFRAAAAKKQIKMVKKKFDEIQDATLTEFEINGQYKIFEKWTGDPSVYRRMNIYIDDAVLYAAKDLAMVRSYYCLYAREAPHVDDIICDIASENTVCYLEAIINGYYRQNQTMLFERELMSASWMQLNSTTAVLDLLCEAVTSRGWDGLEPHWDFTNIALCSALTSLTLSTTMWTSAPTKMAVVARPALELYVRVRRFISNVRAQCLQQQPALHIAALPREWSDVFAPDVTRNIYLLICHVLDNSSKSITASQMAILYGLIEAAKILEASAMPAVLRTGQLTAARVAHAAARTLARTVHHGYQYLAYYTLRALVPSLIQEDEARLTARAGAPGAGLEGPDEGEELGDEEGVFSDLTLSLYHEYFHQLQELVDAALCNYVLCEDMCELMPHSDSHSLVLGLLLLAVVVHRHCELATGDLALHYGTLFNAHSYAEGVVPAALRLLPADVLQYMAARSATLPKHYLPWFIRLQDFDVTECCSSAVVSRLACGAVLRALGGPGGGSARGWAAVQRARTSAAFSRLVTAAVAPPLVNHQLAEVLARQKELGPNTKVSVSLSTRTATCSLRARPALALRVTLAAPHPLQAPRVYSAPPGPDPHCIALYLGYRNGRVLDAMQMWLKAVGSEQRDSVRCYVCYCRAHPQDGSLPAVTCYQCTNTFHTHCLRRWFKTSNRSNCPICRTNF